MSGLDSNTTAAAVERKSQYVGNQRTQTSRHVIKKCLILLERTLLPVVAVCTSILVPGFSSTMAFLGSFAAFTICIIGPIAAHIALTGKRSITDVWILIIIGVMGIWGTVAAVLEA